MYESKNDAISEGSPILLVDCGWPMELGSKEVTEKEFKEKHIESCVPFFKRFIASKRKTAVDLLCHFCSLFFFIIHIQRE